MRKFARVDGDVVMEIFPTADYPTDLIPADGDIRPLFHPDIVWIEITSESPSPEAGWSYSGGRFSKPEPHIPSADKILSDNRMTRDAMLDAATRLINPLLDAIDAGTATEAEKSNLAVLKAFRIDANRVDLTQLNPSWPVFPE